MLDIGKYILPHTKFTISLYAKNINKNFDIKNGFYTVYACIGVGVALLLQGIKTICCV